VSRSTLAVDAGQTEIRAALFGERGPLLATAPGVRRIDDAAVGPDGVTAALLGALDALEIPDGDSPPLGVGLSGFEAAAEDELRLIEAGLRQAVGARAVAIASDGVTSLLGALGDRPGAVVAAGTGVVVVARDGDRWAKVDGWGSLLGDAGSGFEVGRAGLGSALREHDGRGGSAALREAAERTFGPLDGLVRLVHRSDVPTRTVAGFSAEVARVAAAGDPVARAILADAGRELALSAHAALRRVFEPDAPAAVSWTGSVFRAGPAVLEPFRERMAELRPGTELVEPLGDSLAGAALLAERATELRPQAGLLWSAR
jgi:N-acetylglucosamine kinase-like BadF-type ATPase